MKGKFGDEIQFDRSMMPSLWVGLKFETIKSERKTRFQIQLNRTAGAKIENAKRSAHCQLKSSSKKCQP